MKTARIKIDVLKSTVRGAKKRKPEVFFVSRTYCPVCGSDKIKASCGKYRCSLCKSVFLRPKKTKIKIVKSLRRIR